MEKPFDPIDDGRILDTARRRLRYLAEKACGELDAQTLNTLGFHLGAYLCNVKANNETLDVWAGDGAWTIPMGEIEAEQHGWPSGYSKAVSRRTRAEMKSLAELDDPKTSQE